MVHLHDILQGIDTWSTGISNHEGACNLHNSVAVLIHELTNEQLAPSETTILWDHTVNYPCDVQGS